MRQVEGDRDARARRRARTIRPIARSAAERSRPRRVELRAAARRCAPRAALPSMVTPSWLMRRSSSFSSGQCGPLLGRDHRVRRRDGVRVGSSSLGHRSLQCMRVAVRVRRHGAGTPERRCDIPSVPAVIPQRPTERPSSRRSPYEASVVSCCVVLALLRRSCAAAGRAARQPAAQQPPAPAAASAEAARRPSRSPSRKPGEPNARSTKRPSSSAPRAPRRSSINAPATMSVITGADDRERADAELRRAAAQRPRREHHAGLGARHQRDQPRRHRHAGDRPARAARRPQPLPGLLRVRDVGLPAGEPERDQADRSHPRAGVGRLGRQRAQRRRQRDHQVAARDAGHERHARLRRVRPRRTASRRRHAAGTSAARTRRRSTIAGRSSSRRAATRRIRSRGRPARSRAIAPTSAPARATPIPPSRTRARRSRSSTAASTTTTRTAASCRSRAASPAPTASCTPASARSTSTAAR